MTEHSTRKRLLLQETNSGWNFEKIAEWKEIINSELGVLLQFRHKYTKILKVVSEDEISDNYYIMIYNGPSLI